MLILKIHFSHWEISRKDLVAKLMGDECIGPQDQKNFKEILTEEYINKALAIAGDDRDLKYFQARVCLIAGDEKAFELLSELNKINLNNPKILTDLGQCNEAWYWMRKIQYKPLNISNKLLIKRMHQLYLPLAAVMKMVLKRK